MASVFRFPSGDSFESSHPPPHNTECDGGNGGGGDMEERIKILESKVTGLATDITVIKSNYATKQDVSDIKIEIANARSELHSTLRTQAMTIIGSMIAIVSIASGIIIKFLHV